MTLRQIDDICGIQWSCVISATNANCSLSNSCYNYSKAKGRVGDSVQARESENTM